MASAASRGRRLAARAGLPAVLVLAVPVLAWSWGSGPHPIVDFGRELYVAWRLASGDVLYRDLAYFNGPLAAYTNALWFRALGTSLVSLMLGNLVLVAGLVVLLHALLTRVADRLSAAVACAVFVTVFAFTNVDGLGNYNYLTPYSHDLTHGLALAILAVYAFSLETRRPLAAAAGSGLAFGLVALTKIEVFAALAAALGLGWALVLHARGWDRAGARLAAFAGAALLPPLAALALLSLAMPPGDALHGLLTPWRAVLLRDVAADPFYRWTMGFDEPGKHAGRALRWAGRYALFAGALVALGIWARARAAGALSPLRGGAIVAVAAFAIALLIDVRWHRALRPFPILLLVLLVISVRAAVRARAAGGESGALVLRAVLVAFALALLPKMLLHVRLTHYGFALAMPAALVLVVAFLDWLPRWIGAHGGSAAVARAAVLGTVAAGVVATLLDVAEQRLPHARVGSGRDTILRGGPHAAEIDAAVRHIAARLEPHETLAVLPEGVAVNYLTRRTNPTAHLNFMPPELSIFGEDAILEAFRAHPPDFVAIVHRDAAEYGMHFFGESFGQALYAFVQASYRPVLVFGDPPLEEDSAFGIALLERSDRFEDGGPARETREGDGAARRAGAPGG